PPMMPGIALLPEEGPRWPLRLEPDGGYALTDPQTGHARHFPAPSGTSVPLTAITDRNGNRIDIDYDVAGAITEVRHSGGYRIGVETADERITALRLLTTEGNGQTGGHVLIRYGYDEAGNLTEVVNSSGLPQRFSYDGFHRMTGWTDRNGYEYRYTYDERGRAIAGRGSGGFLDATLAYSDDGRTTVVTDSLGHATTYYLNEARQVIAATDPLGHTTWSEWDRYDRLLSRADPLRRITRYAHDEHGNLTAVTRPDGSQVTTVYNDLGLPVAIRQPDGVVWRQDYDHRGNLIAVTDPLGATTRYAYDDRGGLVAVTDPLGAVTRVQTNAAGLPIAITDPLGNTTQYMRDAFGRVSAITDPLGNTVQYAWTLEGALARRVQPDGATERWSYDGEGNLVEYLDALGQITRFEMTNFDQRTAEIGPDGARLEFTYDTELRLTAVTNPQGLVWRYDYDAVGNVVRETDFNGRVLGYAHDACGRLVEQINGAGQVSRYRRDAFGRVVERHQDQAMTTFAYDAGGRLVRATDADCDLHFHRDPLGRIVTEICNGRALSAVYDLAGRRIRRRTPSGAESYWEYDAAGLPRALHAGGQTMRFHYDAAGREIERSIGAQVALTQRWDANHRLTAQGLWSTASTQPAAWVPQQETRQARLIQERAYRYRPDGYVNAIHDQISGLQYFDLDPVGRVTTVRGEHWSERYVYDPAGNIIETDWPVTQRGTDLLADAVGGREYSGALIRRVGTIHYEHDTQGRVVVRQVRRQSSTPLTWRYDWDADDRLRNVVTPDGQHWRYRYDPLGRRIAKQRLAPGGGVFEHIDFSWDGVVLGEQARTAWDQVGGYRQPSVTVWEFEPDNFRPVSQLERALAPHSQQWVDQQFNAIIVDLVGTPTNLVDTAGNLNWRHQTTAWGNDRSWSSLTTYCPLRFPGQYHDAETLLNYNYHRYYDPASASYLVNDPLGLNGGPNPSAYVVNPATWLDPLGLTPYTPRTSNQARREAMRQHGIPTSHQPIGQQRTPAGYQYEYEAPAPGGGTRRVAVTDQTTDRVPGHGPHWEVGEVKPPDVYGRDPLGRLRVRNEGKTKVEYDV
ncbi:MAG TPA: RHS repeat-associated core domain-containing protein, partial [Streptosporangiaceae bacterium]|nr:RHS repeat-associated core domain-containing protein [Streptosporangiaceae bacterium]